MDFLQHVVLSKIVLIEVLKLKDILDYHLLSIALGYKILVADLVTKKKVQYIRLVDSYKRVFVSLLMEVNLVRRVICL